MPILDAHGQPYPAQPRATPLNVPATTGVRHPAQTWAGIASTLTPSRAAMVLASARGGDADDYLTLAEEIEERDLHYASVLQTRKLAISGAEWSTEPADESARADEIAQQFHQQVVRADWFADAIFDLMDALAKGYSVLQPDWETSETQWNYRALTWIDPRMFVFDSATLRELRLKKQGAPDGLPLQAGSFIVHYPKVKTGVRIRGGLAMLATVAHIAKSYTLADWLAFCEVYGMPLRVAKYDPDTMTQMEIDQLKIAIASVGHDAAALVPRGADIEIIDARRPNANGKNVFEGLANYWDAQLSKAILGQTMTTDDGASRAQAEVHNDVRLDLKHADKRSVVATVYGQIAKPWTYYNYGDVTLTPRATPAVDPPEDQETFTKAALPWVQHGGLRVRASEVRARFGLTPPEGDDDAVLGGAPAAVRMETP